MIRFFSFVPRLEQHHPRLFPAFLALAMLPFSVLATGYAVYYSNHEIQMPVIFFLNNPDLYPQDPLREVLPLYSAFFWRIVGILVQFLPLESVFLALFLAARFLGILAGIVWGRVLQPDKWTAALVCGFFMALGPASIVGSGTLVPIYMEHTGFAMAFFLMSTAAFYRNRYGLWALLFLFGLFFNVMYALLLLPYLFFFALLEPAFWKNWRRWLAPALAVFAGIGAVLAFTLLTMAEGEGDPALVLKLSLVRLEHHFNPYGFQWQEWVSFALFLALALGHVLFLRREDKRLFNFLAAETGAALFWLLTAFVAVHILVPSLVYLHPARGTDFFYCLAAFVMLAAWSKRPLSQWRGNALRLLGFLLFVLFMRIQAESDFTDKGNDFWGVLKGYSKIFFRTVIITALVYGILWKQRHNWPWTRSRGLYLFVLFVSLSGCLGHWLYDEKDWLQGPEKGARELANWARVHTTKDAVFLTPMDWAEFRVLAERSLFGTWKDGTVIPWAPKYAQVWRQRLQAIGPDPLDYMNRSDQYREELNERYEDMTDLDVIQLRNRFHLDYWIREEDHPSSFPLLFQYDDWEIRDLRAGIP